MVFHRARRKLYHEDIILNNNILQQIHCTQFLGIIFYDKLKWANHITYIKNKLSNGMGILLKARNVLKYTIFDKQRKTEFYRFDMQLELY